MVSEDELMEILFKSKNKEELFENCKVLGFNENDNEELYYSLYGACSFASSRIEFMRDYKIKQKNIRKYRNEFFIEFSNLINEYIRKDFNGYIVSKKDIAILMKTIFPQKTGYLAWYCEIIEKAFICIFFYKGSLRLSHSHLGKFKGVEYDIKFLVEKYKDKFTCLV